MNFYRLTSGYTHFSGSDVIDAGQKPIRPAKKLTNFPYYFYIDRNDPRPLGDLLSVGCSPLVVSIHAGELLQRFRHPADTHFFPVTLLAVNFDDDEDESREIVGEGCGVLFDWPNDEVMTEADKKTYKTFSPVDRAQGKTPPPVVQRHILEPYDLYDGIGLGILISERVKDAVEDANLTNFRFLSVDAR